MDGSLSECKYIGLNFRSPFVPSFFRTRECFVLDSSRQVIPNLAPRTLQNTMNPALRDTQALRPGPLQSRCRAPRIGCNRLIGSCSGSALLQSFNGARNIL